MLEGAQILLPGLLIAGVTWLAASFAVQGQITTGQLVSFYGYAAFLIAPLRTLTEAADKLTKGHVAARRVIRILSLEPEMRGGSGDSCRRPAARRGLRGRDTPRRVHRRRGGGARGGHRDRRPARPLQRRRRGLRRRAAEHPADRRGPPPDPGGRQRRQAVRRRAQGTNWTSPARPPPRTSPTRCTARARRTSSRRCPTASTATSRRRAGSSPVASSSGSGSPGR
ncbi:hypothetical protein ACFQX6_50460 [Streptosporangium lutulentum]